MAGPLPPPTTELTRSLLALGTEGDIRDLLDCQAVLTIGTAGGMVLAADTEDNIRTILNVYDQDEVDDLIAGVSGGGVADGDKGDIVVSAGGATWTIDAKAVINSKLADVASGTLKGRIAAGPGAPQDLTPEQVRTLLEVSTTGDTNALINSITDNKIAALVGSVPSTLDTLQELAAAINNNANFSTTIVAMIGGKQDANANLTTLSGATLQTFGVNLLSLTNQAALQAAHGVDVASSATNAYSGTITWTGTTAPSGSSTLAFDWYRIGKLVFFEFRFEWSVAGTGITRVEFPFPAGMPVPRQLTGQGNSEVVVMCNGGLGIGDASMNVNQVEARIQLDSSGNPVVWVRGPSTAVRAVYANGEFRCP